jgi:hypothetical protein
MFKKALLFCISMAVICPAAYAAKTTYIATNKRFNFVKLKEVSGREAEERKMTHPATVNEEGLRAALASIKLSRSYVIKKEVDSQQVFDDPSINYLAPNLVKAFAQASPMEEVVFSYLSKNPIFIIRNDRLNIADAWIEGDELHIRFEKLYAKISGDVDKRGNEGRAISKSKGLRVDLDLGPGQKLGLSDPDEVVLDLNYNYVTVPEEKKPPTEGVTMTGKRVPLEQKKAAEAAAAPSKGEAVAAAATPEDAAGDTDVKARLKKLEELKKEGLINKQEYEEKKKEILKDL